MSQIPAYKRCSKCGDTKPMSAYHKSANAKTGLQSWCKSCNKARNKASEYIYYKCEICSGSYRRMKKSPKAERERSKKCDKCTRDYNLAKRGGHAHNYTGTQYFAGRLIAGWKHSAKKRGHVWELQKSDLDTIFNSQSGYCALSGIQMVHELSSPYRPSIDRIDSSVGYILGNVQFVCSVVNVIKNKIDEQEFVRLCTAVVNNDKTKQGTD